MNTLDFYNDCERYIKSLVLLLLIISVVGCAKPHTGNNHVGYDYENFKDTPAWELAKAVNCGDTLAIDRILKKDSTLIDYQEPYHKMTLLMMTIFNQKRATFPYSLICSSKYAGLSVNKAQWRSFCYLLKKGTSLNIIDECGQTPLMQACAGDGYDVMFAEKLIEYGADVNAICPDEYVNELGNSSVLINAAENFNGLEFVKLLVENGANVNYMDKFQNSALRSSLHDCKYDMTLYLLEHGADYNMPVSFIDSTSLNLIEDMRYCMFPLESDDYKAKMRIVAFLEKKGVYYRELSIPESIKKRAKEEYPNSWEEYLENY